METKPGRVERPFRKHPGFWQTPWDRFRRSEARGLEKGYTKCSSTASPRRQYAKIWTRSCSAGGEVPAKSHPPCARRRRAIYRGSPPVNSEGGRRIPLQLWTSGIIRGYFCSAFEGYWESAHVLSRDVLSRNGPSLPQGGRKRLTARDLKHRFT